MRKIFTLSIAIFIVFISQGQMNKGDILAGGYIQFSHNEQESTGASKIKSNGFTLYPTIGRFYRENRLAGIKLIYGHSKNSDSSFETKNYGIGVFIRQYLPLSKFFYVFAEEGAIISTMKMMQNSQFVQHQELKQTNAGIYFFPGLGYAVTKKFQIELALTQLVSLNYNKQNNTQLQGNSTVTNKTSSFSLQAGENGNAFGFLTFGVRFLLN